MTQRINNKHNNKILA